MIAPLGFMPGSYGGRTRLGYSSGSPAHGLGVVDPDVQQAALNAGMDQGTLNTLLALGATNAQVTEVALDPTSLPAVMNELTGGPAPQPITAADMRTVNWSDFGVEASLAALDSDITGLESDMAANLAVATALGGAIQNERAQYNTWAAQYQGYVNQAGGNQIYEQPDGTIVVQQATIGAVGWALIAIASAAALFGLAEVIKSFRSNTVAATIAQAQAVKQQSSTQQTANQNANSLYQQAAAADARGDHATAAQLRQEADAILKAGQPAPQPPQPPKPPSGFWDWVQTNWQLSLGFGVLAFVLAKRK